MVVGSDRERLDAAKATAKRWRARATPRKKQIRAADNGEHTEADSANRLCKRVTRLRTLMESRVEVGGPVAESQRAALAAEPLTPDAITDQIVERAIGDTRDFLSVEFFERGLQAAMCVGRVLTNDDINGTGFLVAPDMLVTNWHVLDTDAVARRSSFELDYEANTFGARKTPQSFTLDPDAFFLSDKAHDIALVAVSPASRDGRPLAEYGHLPLIADEGKITIGESVNIVQHPKGRIKQIVIRNSRLVDLPTGDQAGIFFHYEADTEQGSSGSPVFNDQWEVVALHHQGVPKTNAKGQIVDSAGRVMTRYDEEEMVWIANEGVRTSKLVAFLRAAELTGDRAKRRDALLARWESESAPTIIRTAERIIPPPAVVERAAAPAPRDPIAAPILPPAPIAPRPSVAPGAALVGSGETTFVLPLRISVALGAQETESAPASLSALAEAIKPDPSDARYERRPGYQPRFLGFDAPLPSLADARRGPLLTFGADRATELRYHHFSVLMNARRRLAYVSAVNLNADAPFQHERDKGGDSWFFDPRVPKRNQAGNAYYASNPLDRGHLVRRDDAAWGETAREAKLANDDTFHWTNCAPQHEVFNQGGLASSRGLKLWGNLESAVSELAPSYGAKLSVFNGPVFDDRDPPYRDDLFLPQAYWKLILLRGEDEKPRALAFQLSQAGLLADLTAERFAPAELADFEVFQIPLTKLAAATGLDFGPMAEWDPMAEAGDARSEESAIAGRALLVRDEGAIRL